MLLRTRFAALIALTLPVSAFAADAHLKLPSFNKLQSQAVQSVDVSIGATPLKFASMFIDKDPDTQDIKNTLAGIKEISIRSYTFDRDNAYPKEDVESVRSQLSNSIWSPLATIRDNRKNENIDVSVAFEHDKVVGVAIVANSPREFTIVNIVGEIAMEHIASLAKQLHITDSELGRRSINAL